MTKKIFRAICLVAVAVFLASLTLIMGVLYSYFSSVQMKQLHTQATLAARGVSAQGDAYLDGLDTGASRLTWIAADGRVLFDSQADAAKMDNHLQRQEVQQALQTGSGESVRYSETLMERELYAAERLPDGSVIRLAWAQYTVLTLLLSTLQPIVIVAVATVALSLLLAFRLSRRIVKPLNEMDLDDPVAADDYDELSPMVTRLRSQQNQLRLQERELQRQRSELDAATANLSEGLLLLNENGVILSANRSAARLLGVDKDCIGRELLTVNAAPQLRELLRSAAGGEHAELTLPIGGSDYQINASPVVYRGTVTGVALLIFDITDKEKAEQMRREFTANVSHELKTPLHTISGCAELLAEGVVKAEDVPKFSRQIHSEAKRMIALVEDIIGLSHLDEGAKDLSREDTDLCAIAEKTVQSLQPLAAEAEVSLSFSGQSAPMVGIPQLLSGIVFNLCDNAVKYNKKGGSVLVTVEDLPQEVRLRVADTGIGIPFEQQERIFERFYRVDRSHSKELGGTGLGLSIVKHAAKLHNAAIELESSPGDGTTVTVIFPKK